MGRNTKQPGQVTGNSGPGSHSDRRDLSRDLLDRRSLSAAHTPPPPACSQLAGQAAIPPPPSATTAVPRLYLPDSGPPGR